MKKILGSLFAALGLALALQAHASPTDPKAGVDYQVLQPAQPVNVPAGKIEVTEFFWYGCPHCAAFDPKLEAWIKKQNKDVVFDRVPVAFRKDFEPHQRLYYALVTLGREREMTPKIFHEIQVNKDYLLSPATQADFLAKQGIDRKAFLNAYNAFSMGSQVARADQMIQAYKIDGVPTIAIQGKYIVSPSITDAAMQKAGNPPKTEQDIFTATLQTVDAIVAQIRDKKL
ncbi:thiol:disulfide interchange protein DsbA/DsbL [Pandoraea sp.]|uniref:thiol:disulfide interchange protein DsbA/DsbL n=1 Tax=Pandoraea sp. TaxID=1883445 RepID=UPI00120D3064|nr:thiol:disulfide interchange protein DsbA/DsbL [Pandoraea sp.]MBU6492439.1 thiol:disulfide interchange protein DsbA/DsbL [Burkholderiales bacterium]MDE2288671.1 thiol:disulfide interchange protein DsbA/DsbL [Burkholderiales bacterium]MDE2608274.1 thiol:disulfide interchange protein DsbA/DsbL [Burkholderiales bacterium]TAL52116.1 MAG: thiol:disulfide interchange protein DsbA/DsbL [Pandoraea sp.]TAM16007.1 MAG: thiol:disulfide interchange protein DsbA/DsbL [Pandoraea sp.]